jgi:hypothetical protein
MWFKNTVKRRRHYALTFFWPPSVPDRWADVQDYPRVSWNGQRKAANAFRHAGRWYCGPIAIYKSIRYKDGLVRWTVMRWGEKVGNTP